MNKLNLIEQRYGKLTVLCEYSKRSEKGNHIQWVCQCDCGNEVIVPGAYLRSGKKTSCGCLRWSGDGNRRHGMTGTRQYQAWSNMKRRCNDKANKEYANYGGRGITYCDEWETFEGFWADMQEGYSDELTIDRIDVNGNYCKENCKWSTSFEQANNTTASRHYDFDGGKYTVAQIAQMTGVDKELMRSRIQRGVPIEETLEPKVEAETLTFRGETKTIREFAEEYGMSYRRLKKRLEKGWSVEKALTEPLRTWGAKGNTNTKKLMDRRGSGE